LEKEIISNCFVKSCVDSLNAVLAVFSKRYREEKSNNEKEQYKKQQEKDSKIICVRGIIRERGYYSNSKETAVAEIHDLFGKENLHYPSLSICLSWHCAEKVDDFIFCIGGAIDTNEEGGTNSVYRMDLKNSKRWDLVANMEYHRYLHASAVIDDKIVVAGGCYNGTPLKSVEVFEKSLTPKSIFSGDYWQTKWRKLSPMTQARSGHALVACNNSLIAIGGSGGGYDACDSVEILSELEGQWRCLKPMNVRRNRLAAVVCDGQIYAIGGKSSTGIEKSVEKYDFSLKTWTYVASMNSPRWGHSACALYGRILVVGGQNEQGGGITQIECFNPDKDQWSTRSFNLDSIFSKAKSFAGGQALVIV